MRDYREISLWNNVPEEEWSDWHWQFHNRIVTLEQLEQVIELTDEETEGIEGCMSVFRMAITPYYASLINPADRNCPVRRQAVPSVLEQHSTCSDLRDPLHEDMHSPVPKLIHRYPDRVLMLVTDQCSVYCRHCTRRRRVGVTERAGTEEQFDAAIDYVRRTPAVRDVLISGGLKPCVAMFLG